MTLVDSIHCEQTDSSQRLLRREREAGESQQRETSFKKKLNKFFLLSPLSLKHNQHLLCSHLHLILAKSRENEKSF